jgi:anthranilate synthase component 2
MKKILVIDNYDSFTYNLVHYLQDLGCDVTVKRNDQLTLNEVEPYDKIVLSPGPGIPDEALYLNRVSPQTQAVARAPSAQSPEPPVG